MIHDQLESFNLQKMQTGSKDKKHKSKERSYSHKKDKKKFATNINFQRGGGRSQLWPHGKWSPLFCCSEYHWQVISSWLWIVISLLWWHCRKGSKCHKMLGKICIDVQLCIVHVAGRGEEAPRWWSPQPEGGGTELWSWWVSFLGWVTCTMHIVHACVLFNLLGLYDDNVCFW